MPEPEPENGDDADGFDIDTDVLYQLLSTKRRRNIIRFTAVAAATGVTPILAKHIANGVAAVEEDLPSPTEDKSRAVYTSITQDRDHRPSELTRLANAGILDYDDTPKNKTVAPGPNFVRVLAAMDALEGVFSGTVHFETTADDADVDERTEDGGVALSTLTDEPRSDGGALGVLIRA